MVYRLHHRSKVGQGKVVSGKVHALTAKVSHRVSIPIEYVTEYNLAGGEGLVTTTANYPNPQPMGVTGILRFADSHSNDQSGYYKGFKVLGIHDATNNPDTRNLQTEVDNAFGADKYYIPTLDQFVGVASMGAIDFRSDTGITDQEELMRIGSGPDEFRRTYFCDYSKGFSANGGSADAIIYAIRFKAHTRSGCPTPRSYTYYDFRTNARFSVDYSSATDNSIKCAYRFRRIGGWNAWTTQPNANLTHRLIVDVVYLGEELVPTTLTQISNSDWWSNKVAEGLVISKTIPAAGFIITCKCMY